VQANAKTLKWTFNKDHTLIIGGCAHFEVIFHVSLCCQKFNCCALNHRQGAVGSRLPFNVA